MATDDVQRLVTGRAAAPATFKVPGNGQIRPKAIFASFDGTGAGGPFKPALKITSDAGELVGIYPVSDAVAAGASATVSWFPRVAAAAAAGTGIQFDTDPQPGDYLYVETTGFDPATFLGMYLNDSGGDGFRLQTGGSQNSIFFQPGNLDFLISDEMSITGHGIMQWDDSFGLSWVIYDPSFTPLEFRISSRDGPVRLLAGREITIQSGATGDILLQSANNVVLDPSSYVLVQNLPVADPGVSGALWNNGGVVNVSP